ncbi:hypothetical protein C7H19_15470 [Aphanothece hegewaldii CCALA 016]|uniref:Cadherin domain-containing protein n=1 Tax=Aphanothece hegewaldii CCALA 016 TaxID=2107694 RepID=A0A2T1LVR0_9CHRO|nr:putative Ig domain-containing protein [Aphanothece hegewaldii]PSF35821.1 hypothetical protein C7H19_15470 [Aphanothece hegewaldii CCALA 016]
MDSAEIFFLDRTLLLVASLPDALNLSNPFGVLLGSEDNSLFKEKHSPHTLAFSDPLYLEDNPFSLEEDKYQENNQKFAIESNLFPRKYSSFNSLSHTLWSQSGLISSNLDPLTGLRQTQISQSLKNNNTPRQSSLNGQLKFAITAEGTVTVNGGSDFDGDPIKPVDDALIHAGAGFTLNGQVILPVQRDAAGKPIVDATGQPILVNQAVTVAAGYQVANVSNNNRYSGLLPPQIVPKQTVNIPDYLTLKTTELNRHIPSGTTEVIFKANSKPLNNVTDWNQNFPTPGTATNPKVVKVTGGGLNIPANVNLNHYVLIIENGDINFNGNGHNLNKVVLVTNNGNINLSNVQATEVTALASNSINMNSGAKFAGSSLLANGSGNITFNGATKTTTDTDALRVISSGQITYNGASNTRGHFLANGTFTFNGNSTLIGSISTKNHIIFNGGVTVIGAANPFDNNAPVDILLNPNTIAENVSVNTIVGNLSTIDPNSGDQHTYAFVPGIGDNDNGAFTLIGNQLQINNSPNFETLNSYSIRVRSTDAGGLSVEKNLTVSITNVNEAPTLITLSNNSVAENSAAWTIIGQLNTTDPDAGENHTYTLINDAGGRFRVVNNQLMVALTGLLDFETLNTYTITVRSTDAGGLSKNQQFTISLTNVNEAPTELTLNSNTIAENSPNNSVIGNLNTSDPDAGDNHTYTLVAGDGDNHNAAFSIVGNQLQLNNSPDYESQSSYKLRVQTTDAGGISLSKAFTINVTNANEAPRLTSTAILGASVGELYTYNITTTDPDAGDFRTISASGLPSWLTLTNNGDGTATLSGTPTEQNLGVNNITLTVTDAGGLNDTQSFNLTVTSALILQENQNFSSFLSQDLVIPSQPSLLKFKVNPLFFDLNDPDSINDAFEVSLLNQAGNSLVHTLGQDSFFNITEGLTAAKAIGTSYDAATQIITVNLVAVAPNQEAKLVFRLVNNDSDTTSYVQIRDIQLIDAPSGTELPTGTNTPSQNGTNLGTPLNLTNLVDVTPSIQLQYQRTTFNDQTNLLYAETAIKNIGSYSISTPLLVTVRNISDPTVQLRNPDGVTLEGIPYYDFSHLVTDGKLNALATSQIGHLVFSNPNQVQFTYDVVVLSVLNQNPVIQTQPDTEIIEGQAYQYDVNAIDPDSDTLTYKLLIAPLGMTINATTGMIDWTTTTASIGNHVIQVEVSDGVGGITQQTYTLSVIEQPPNRPPLFTSNPIVDAYINQLYQYDANAIDPDLDYPLSYNLVIGPNGMTINAGTGQIEWTPPAVVLLGDTVLGRIGMKGENDEFTFSGMKGQKIYFDPLQYSGNEYKWRVDIYSPSGRKIVDNINFLWYQNRLLTLEEDGNYKIIVDTQNEQTGTYGFSLIESSLTDVIPFDTIIQGTLNPGTEDDIFRFTANQGQKLYFDQLSKNGQLGWTLYNEANQVVAENNNFDDLEVDLATTGEYILAIRGYSAFTTKVDYSFTIVTPDLLTQPLTLGNIVTSDISEKGEYDTYTFTGNLGQKIYFDVLNQGNSNATRADLYSPSGQYIFNRWLSQQDSDPITLTEAGQYRLILDSSNDKTDIYSFNLLNISQPSPINLDTDVTGNLNFGQGTYFYQFSGTAGQRLYFDTLTNSNAYWKLYNLANQILDSRAFSDYEYILSNTDTYLIAIQGYSNTPVDYKFRLITPEITTTVLTLGTLTNSNPITAAISEKGEYDTYTFVGNLGQKIYFDVLNEGGSYTTRADLYSPSGQYIFRRWLSQQDSDPITLTEAGQYYLIIDGREENTNNYSFSLLDLSQVSPINLDTDVTGNLNLGQGTYFYQFNGTAGQRLYFDTLTNSNAYWKLYNLANQILDSRAFSDYEYILSNTDTYLIAIQGYSNTPVDYKFRIITPEITTTVLSLGTLTNPNLITAAISEKGEYDTYTFVGNLGQKIYFDVLNEGGFYTTKADLYSPSGQYIFSRWLSQQDSDPITLTEAGQYYLIIDGREENTDNYSFSLLDLSQVNTINLDTDITGKLELGRETDFYKFDGISGQKLFFDSLINATNAYWTIYNLANRVVRNEYITTDFEVTLDTTNTYLLAIRGNNGTPVDYKFNVKQTGIRTPITPIGTPITIGDVISGSLNTQSQVNSYTFSGTVGQQLFYDALGGSLFYLRLYDPTGQEIFTHDIRNDRAPNEGLTLTTNGTYRITVSEYPYSQFTAGNYQFRLLDRTSASIVNLDTDITGTFDNGGEESDTYRLTLTENQYLYFDSSAGNYPNAWILYGPGGQYITGNYPYIYQDRELFVNAGDYWLVMQGNGSSNINYNLRIVTPELNTAPMTIGNTISGSISEAGEQDTYTFTGTVGQQLFYDALGGDYFRLKLFDPTGREIFNTDSRYDRVPYNVLVLSMNGTYRVVVDGDGEATGNYKFRLIDRASSSIVNLDTDIAGTLDNDSLESDTYRFTITESQYLYFDGITGNYPNAWILYGNGGQKITDNDINRDREQWLNPGDYWLVMQGNGSSNSNYNLRIVTPELNTTPMTIGNIVTGSISETGEQDTYTFTGTVGQQLFYDALGGDYLKLRFFDPTGREIFNADSRYDRAPHDGLILNLNGTYRVVVDGDEEATGNYKFRLLDRASANIVNLDTDITGTFDNGGKESDTYRFTITENQYLYFDGITGDYPNAWILYGNSGQYITSKQFYQNYNSSYYNDEERWLSPGEYWLVMQGNSSSNSNYNLRIVTPQKPTTAYQSGTIITNSISEQGEQDTYTFTGTVGQQLFYDALAGSPNITARLYSPTGREICNYDVRSDFGPDNGYTLNETGVYRLIIDGNGDATGNYGFRLFDYSAATTITFNTDLTGTFVNGGKASNTYRFTVAHDQYFYFDGITGDYPNAWILYGNGGQYVTSRQFYQNYNSSYYNDEERWLSPGNYFLVVQGNGATNTNYKLQVVTPELVTLPLTLGNTVNSNLAQAGEQDIYTFTGTVGQQLFYDALIGNLYLKARLYAPSGSLVVDKDTNTDWSPFTLAENGIYRLVIDGYLETTGNYNFILSDLAQSAPLTFDNAITGTLNLGNQVNFYQFTGNTGQRLKFALSTTAWNGANWILYDPNSGIVKSPTANSPDFEATLASNGIYTLAIIGNSNNLVDYTFQVSKLITTPVTNTGLNNIQSGNLSAGQIIDYNFTVNAGTLVLFDSQHPVWDYSSKVQIFNPDGTLVFSNQEARNDRLVWLEQSGNYKLQLYGYYLSSAVNYQFNLLEFPRNFGSPNANYVGIGNVNSGTLNDKAGKVYTFDGIAGQKILLNTIAGSNCSVNLYDYNGRAIFTGINLDWSSDSLPITLTQSGLYYLLVQNNSTVSCDYSFQILDLKTAPDINYGLPYVGSINNGQQSRFFKLKANAGERLYFDSIFSTPSSYWTNYHWKLFDNGNNQLFDTYQSYDTEVVIPTTGEYFLYLQGGENLGQLNYNFKVVRTLKPIADVLLPGTGESSSNNADALGLFPVKIAVKDTQGTTTIQEFKLRLWPSPENGNPVIISTPKTRFALVDQIYQYQLQTIDPDHDHLVYRLLDAPNGAFVNNDSGEILWTPEASIIPGSQFNFQVEVSDKRGGKDIQTFTVEVYNNLGKIQGAVFDDRNNNGYRDTALIEGERPDIVFAIDISGSTGGRSIDWTTTDLETFTQAYYTILDMELATVLALTEQLILQERGNTVKIGLVFWDTEAYLADLNPAESGIQVYTTALADHNNNGILDLKEALNQANGGGGTDFTPGLIAAKGVLDASNGTPNIIFMSDGFGNVDEGVVAELRAAGVKLTAFGIGSNAGIEQLRKIDPNAIKVTDFKELIDIFGGWNFRDSTEPFLENITVYLDLNNNEVLDELEPRQVTKQDNSNSILGESPYYFTFDNLLPGTYTVRQVIPNGTQQTTPKSGSFIDTVTVTGGETFSHLFGLNKISSPPNQNPFFLSQISSFFINVGEIVVEQAFAQDSDADELSYDLPLHPLGMTIDAQTGTLVWKPQREQVGHFNVILRVKDGRGGFALQTFSINVNSVNTPPIFTSTVPENTNAQVGKVFHYQAMALDPDGDTLTYSLVSGAPNGIAINAQTGLITWTPNSSQLGSQEFTVKVFDVQGGEALQKVLLVVKNATSNQAPIIISIPRTQSSVGNRYYYALSATDPDGDLLTYSLATAPAGMTISDGVIIWKPTATQSGEHTIKIRVNDGNLFVEQTYLLTIANQSLNRAPNITSAPNLVTNLEQIYNYNLSGQDPDGDVLFWSLVQAPEGMVIDAQTGALRFSAQSDHIGRHAIIVRLFDNYGAYTTQEYTLTVNGTNTPTNIVSTPITRASLYQTYTYTVVAIDPENSPITYSLGRKPNGMTIDQTGRIQWTPNQTGTYEIDVLISDAVGATTKQTYQLVVGTQIINQAPIITSTPSFRANVGSTYTYQVTASDPDGQALTYQLLEAPQGMTLEATTGLLQWTNPLTGNYQVVVAAFDLEGLGAMQSYQLTAKVNSLPVIGSTPPLQAIVGRVYRYDLIASDPDGGQLTYRLDPSSINKGIVIDSLGRLSWTPTTSNLGTHNITITISDQSGASIEQNFKLDLLADTISPKVSLIASQQPVNKGESVTLIVTATDNIRVKYLNLTLNGQAVIRNANGLYTFTPNQAGQITAIATAIDEAGNQSTAIISLEVLDKSDVTAPVIDLPLLANRTFTAPTEIIGTVTDNNLLYYSLEVAPVGTEDFREIFRGTKTVADGSLGTFDPSLLSNDVYTLRLSATDAGGNTVFIDETVNIEGELKLGNFQLSFTDLALSVSGIPITVTRTYDTLTANERDDFGYGWRLEFRDTNLRTSLGRDRVYEQFGILSKGFKAGDKVYITLPGGLREAYTFQPELDRLGGYLLDLNGNGGLWHPKFVSQSGSKNTLSVSDVLLTLTESGQYAGLAGLLYNPIDPYFSGQYTLTTLEGIIYEIEAATGDLLTATDTNGNQLTFSDAGIESNSGVEVKFGRDAVNRITSITDPMNNVIRYEYDAEGDLVKVTDREDNTTKFEYNNIHAHYLDLIVDPLNRETVRTEYDENGRLKKIIDVNGSDVELVYDLENSVQTVKDVFGNPTTYVYDERGNIVQKVNALGGITKRTFDDNNNLLSITDSLNHTTKYAYDSKGNIISITDSLGNTAYYTYNNFGQVISRTDPLGNTISYTYDSRRNLVSTTNPEGQSVHETTDKFGNTTSIIDALGNVTQFEYDARSNVTRQIDTFGNETIYTYDNNGNQLTETVKVTTPNGLQTLTTNWTYDTEGRVITKTDPAGNVIRQEYDALGNLVAIIEESMSNRRTEYRYDEKNQLIETVYPDGTSERIFYDEAGRKISEIDQAGQITHFIYDALNRLIEIIYPDDTSNDLTDNPRTQTEYNAVGQVVASLDERGNRTEYEYDAAGRRILQRNALTNKTIYTYNAIGSLLTETDALGRTTSYVYDPEGRKVETRFADGTSIKTDYNALGLKIAETNQAGNTTRFTYDVLNRLSEVIHPDNTPNDLSDNPRNKTEYDELGQVIASIDERGNRQEYEYDRVGRLIESRSDCLCRRKIYTYDAAGNRLTETDPLNHTTQFVYDQLNRLIKTQFADGTYTTTTYDLLGRAIASTDQASQTTVFEYDALGQLTAVIDALLQRTEYSYDLTGNLIQIKDANHHSTQYEYDALNRRTDTILSMGQRSTTTYDAVGNVASTTDFNSQTITYQYDALNRMITKQFPDTTAIKYTYTPTGQVKSIFDERGGTTTYDYDVLSRLIERIDPDQQFIRYSYDAASNRTAIITASGTTTYSYDRYNQLQTVTAPNGGIISYTYDKAGNLIQTELPNNTVETRQYDDLNRLVYLENKQVGAEIISSYRYTLDSVGNRLKVEENNTRQVNYTYDALYRLLDEKITDAVAGNRNIDYTYDASGNRLTRNDSAEGLTTYTYDNNDRLLNETLNGQVTSYTYDHNGNTLTRTNSISQTVYNWDYENRLIEAEISTSTGTTQNRYQYNSEGIRIAATVNGQETRYLIDANQAIAQVIEEYNPNGTVQASYVYGRDLISQTRNGVTSFYHVDGIGSTRILSDVNGLVTDSYNYDAYGQQIQSTGNTVNNYLYTGEQFDPNLGDYYLRARYYNPSVGRFTARDPFEGLTSEPLSLAKYPYVHSNPVNFTDPSGLFIQETSISVTIQTLLATTAYAMLLRPIGKFREFDTDDAVVPGYLKDLNHDGVNKFLKNAITNSQYQVVKKKVQECNGTQGSGNCDLFGFPVIVWGLDLPEIHNHTRDAISQGKPSFLARAAEVNEFNKLISPSIWSRLHPQGLKKLYPSGKEFDANWYDFTPECPWDNSNPKASYKAAKGLACDEYPYHSTLQGAWINYKQGNVSLRRVDFAQNQQQGDWLANFYYNAGVARLDPYSSWFGVKTTNSIPSYWINKWGKEYSMGGTNLFPDF